MFFFTSEKGMFPSPSPLPSRESAPYDVIVDQNLIKIAYIMDNQRKYKFAIIWMSRKSFDLIFFQLWKLLRSYFNISMGTSNK